MPPPVARASLHRVGRAADLRESASSSAREGCILGRSPVPQGCNSPSESTGEFGPETRGVRIPTKLAVAAVSHCSSHFPPFVPSASARALQHRRSDYLYPNPDNVPQTAQRASHRPTNCYNKRGTRRATSPASSQSFASYLDRILAPGVCPSISISSRILFRRSRRLTISSRASLYSSAPRSSPEKLELPPISPMCFSK